VLPFEVNALDLRGRLTRLGPALDEVLANTIIRRRSAGCSGSDRATTLLGSSLKFEPLYSADPDRWPVSF
jgi:molecular chaperone Hsp33